MEHALTRNLTHELIDRVEDGDLRALMMDKRGIVSRVVASRVPDEGHASLSLDENDRPVIVGVHGEAVMRFRAVGSTRDDFAIETELLTPTKPCVRSTVRELALSGNFNGGTYYERQWTHEFENGQVVRVSTGGDSLDPHDAATALSVAVGWPEQQDVS